MTDKTKELVKEYFGKRSKFYSSSFFTDDERLKKIVELAKPKKNDVILDVATGAGYLALEFGARAKRVIGIDLTKELLDQAEAAKKEFGLDNIEFKLADAENLPFDDASFDIVSCRFSFHHFPNPLKALGGVKRVLKENGCFVLADPISSEDSQKSKAHNEFEKLADPSHVKMYAVSEIKRMLKTAGFNKVTKHQITPVNWVVKDHIEKKMKGFDEVARKKCIKILKDSIDEDKLSLNVRYENQKLVFDYQIAAFVAKK